MLESQTNFDATATVDPSTEPGITTNEGLWLLFSGAKIKLNSIDELIKVVKTINNKLSEADYETTRAWVHKIQKTHPKVDDAVKDLEYFKPISNEIGSTYLMHTPDTQTLALEDWKSDTPNPLRRLLEQKMDESYTKIKSVYEELNKAMSRNISEEFFSGRKDAGNNDLDKTLLNNDFHIAGDYAFKKYHVDELEDILKNLLLKFVGGAKKLMLWLNDPAKDKEAIYSGIEITIEGNEVTVNLNGDKVGVIASVIDTTPISVIPCNGNINNE